MALVQTFEDASGNVCGSSYWRATQISIDSLGMAIHVVFLGWKDGQAYSDKKSPLSGAVKAYHITEADFLAVAMAAPTGASLYDVLANATESFALASRDIPTDEKDSEGKPVYVSFFAGATQV